MTAKANETTQASNSGWGGFLSGLGDNVNKYVGVLLDSQREPAPTMTQPHQATGVNTAPVQDAAGNSLPTQTPQSFMQQNPWVMYAAIGFVALIGLLIILKIIGVF